MTQRYLRPLIVVAAVITALAGCSSGSSTPSAGTNTTAAAPVATSAAAPPASTSAATPTSSGPAASSTAAASAPATTGASKASGSITVWVDAARLPVAKAYQATHPNVKVNIVTFDGDGNGATT